MSIGCAGKVHWVWSDADYPVISLLKGVISQVSMRKFLYERVGQEKIWLDSLENISADTEKFMPQPEKSA